MHAALAGSATVAEAAGRTESIQLVTLASVGKRNQLLSWNVLMVNPYPRGDGAGPLLEA
jgi:hypothetical protein